MSKIQTNQIQHTANGAAVFTLPQTDGSTGQFIKTDGSGALSFATPTDTDTNDYVKLQHNSTGGGTYQYLVFNNLDVATYKYFDFTISLTPETDDKLLRFRFRTGNDPGTSTSGSSSYVIGDSGYGYSYYQHWGTDNFGEIARTSQVSITFADTIGNNTNNYEGMALRARIHFANSNDTSAAGLQNWVDWAFAAKDPDNNINQGRGTGAYHGSNTLYPTGFHVYMNSGAINAHTYTLYGQKR